MNERCVVPMAAVGAWRSANNWESTMLIYGSYQYRKGLRDAFGEFLGRFDFDFWITLSANRGSTYWKMRDLFKGWLARVDRYCLGRDWQRRGEERTGAVAIIEELTQHAHLHVAASLPDGDWAPSTESKARIVERIWRDLCPDGDAYAEWVYWHRPVVDYMLKRATREDGYNSIMLASEFHPQDRGSLARSATAESKGRPIQPWTAGMRK